MKLNVEMEFKQELKNVMMAILLLMMDVIIVNSNAINFVIFVCFLPVLNVKQVINYIVKLINVYQYVETNM